MDRRHFLRLNFYLTASACLSLHSGIAIGKDTLIAKDTQSELTHELTSFIQISHDGKVTLLINQQEMGQGVRTSIAQLICEELAFPLDRVNLLQAPAHPDKFGRQLTGGSGAIRRSWVGMRNVGAAAKQMLLQAAAKIYQVKLSQLMAENGEVLHQASGLRIPYHTLVTEASMLPIPENPPLINRQDFKYIGKSVPNIDTPKILNGEMQFGTDIKLAGMKYASLIRSPTLRGTVKSVTSQSQNDRFDFYVQQALPLLEDMPQTREAVVVVAASNWEALQARQDLLIEWETGKVHYESSQQLQTALLALSNQSGVAVRSEGEALSDTKAQITAQYYTPMQYQAQMEPMVCTCKIENGQCHVWAPVQWPHFVQRSVAAFLKLEVVNVTIQPLRMGGSFGRKYCDDFVIECVAIAQKFQGTAIQTLWTREDDIICGGPQVPCAHQLSASFDSQNYISHWRHRFCQATTAVTQATNDAWQAEQGQTPIPYAIDNIQCEFTICPADMDTTAHRAVFYPTNAFAINVFIDEIAEKTGKDTIELHKSMLSKQPELIFADWMQGLPPHLAFKPSRLSGVLHKVQKMAGKKPKNYGRGFALQRAMFSYVAAIIDVKRDKGKLSIVRVCVAVDIGTVVNPNNARAQVEGSIIWGLSTALFEQLTMTDGVVDQSNFHDYRVMRQPEVPEMAIEFIYSEHDPTGVGEPVVTVMAPALVNAIFDLTGQRIRQLPIINEVEF